MIVQFKEAKVTYSFSKGNDSEIGYKLTVKYVKLSFLLLR